MPQVVGDQVQVERMAMLAPGRRLVEGLEIGPFPVPMARDSS